MKKYMLPMCLLLLPTLSLASGAGVICENRYPMGREAARAIVKISQESNQTYTAHLDIISGDDKPIASETITDLACYFSTRLFPVVRCHYRSADSYALSIGSVLTTRMELIYLIDDVVDAIEVSSEEMSLSMDVVREDGSFVPYGYGNITFATDECERL